jgi:hypothetical protein
MEVGRKGSRKKMNHTEHVLSIIIIPASNCAEFVDNYHISPRKEEQE